MVRINVWLSSDENLQFVCPTRRALQTSGVMYFLDTAEMQHSFSNPKYLMVLTEPFLMRQLKTVSLYYLRWVFDRYMRKWKVSQWEDTAVWAALQLWQRIHRYFGCSESCSSVVLHSEVSQSIFCVLLFQLLLIIAEGMFLNANFPKITRNHATECHGPFPLPCLHLV